MEGDYVVQSSSDEEAPTPRGSHGRPPVESEFGFMLNIHIRVRAKTFIHPYKKCQASAKQCLFVHIGKDFL